MIRQSVENASGRNQVRLFDTEGGRRGRLSNEQTDQVRVPENIVDETGSQIRNRNMNMIDVETGRSNSRRRRSINQNNSNLITNQNYNFPPSLRMENSQVADILSSEEGQPIIEDVPVPESSPNLFELSLRNQMNRLPEQPNIPNPRSARSISKSIIEEYSETKRKNINKKLSEQKRKKRNQIKEKKKKKRKKKVKRKNMSLHVFRSNITQLLETNLNISN